MFGRLLCKLGLHNFEWRDKTEIDSNGFIADFTQHRCKRKECPLSYFWRTANVDRIRQPW
jgi:hypothetical protein